MQSKAALLPANLIDISTRWADWHFAWLGLDLNLNLDLDCVACENALLFECRRAN